MSEEVDDEEEVFEFRVGNWDALPAGSGQAYPLSLSWFAERFPDLLETVKHDISIDFERSKSETIVFTAQHYSRSKKWNLMVRSVRERDLAEVSAVLKRELPGLLRDWFHESIRDAQLYTLRHLWFKCFGDRFEYGDLDER